LYLWFRGFLRFSGHHCGPEILCRGGRQRYNKGGNQECVNVCTYMMFVGTEFLNSQRMDVTSTLTHSHTVAIKAKVLVGYGTPKNACQDFEIRTRGSCACHDIKHRLQAVNVACATQPNLLAPKLQHLTGASTSHATEKHEKDKNETIL